MIQFVAINIPKYNLIVSVYTFVIIITWKRLHIFFKAFCFIFFLVNFMKEQHASYLWAGKETF